MEQIRKVRKESFGAIVFSENPGFTAFIDHKYACKLKLPDSTIDLPSDIYSAPLDVHMILTENCNLRCLGCYVIDNESAHQYRQMDFELAKSIVRNLAKLGVFTVSLGGGEPFLYPFLFELAAYIRQQNILPNITTNGTLINESNAQLCKIFGNLHLSIHSMNELDRLENTIRMLKRVGVTPGINLLITQETYFHLDTIFKWASNLGITKILLLRFKITTMNSQNISMQMSLQQEKELFLVVKKLSRKYRIIPIFDCSLFTTIAVHKISRKKLRYYDVNGCRGGNTYIAVDIDGNYKPCSFWDTTFGKADNLDFAEWVNNEQLLSFRAGPKDERCEPCNYLELCNKGCRLLYNQVCHSEFDS